MAFTHDQKAYEDIHAFFDAEIDPLLYGGVVTPNQQNLMGWSFDPAVTSGNSFVATAGQEVLVRVVAVKSGLVSNVILHVGSAGVTLTANQCWAGLRNASGLLLAKTADQSGAWISTGSKIMPLASQVVVEAGQPYYVVYVHNGTTQPGFQRGVAASMVNVGTAAGQGRVMNNGSGQTDLVSSISMPGAPMLAQAVWAGIS